MRKIMDSIKNIYNGPYKKLIKIGIVVIVVFLLLEIIPGIFGLYKKYTVSKSPIVDIEATNETIYELGDTILPKEFTVKAIHENGDKTSIDSSEIEISRETLEYTGEITEIEITYDDFTCVAEVKCKREEVNSVECGKINKSDVRAVLYSNGELAFEGKGDILQYHENEAPWVQLAQDDVPIRAVSFEEDVKPLSLDYYFESFENLEYIENIPTSVESISKMCLGCVSLEKGPDLSKCKKLLNMDNAFEECHSLIEPAVLPTSLTSAMGCYKNCENLKDVGNIDKCNELIYTHEMYFGCQSLLSATFPKNAMAATEMYANCINLEKVTELPDTLEAMSGIFSGDVLLKTVPNIPKNAKSISHALKGCKKIEGTIQIDGIYHDYNGFLEEACVGNPLDLKGSSPLLDQLANTSSSTYITVNGNKPDPEKTYFDYNEYMRSLEPDSES